MLRSDNGGGNAPKGKITGFTKNSPGGRYGQSQQGGGQPIYKQNNPHAGQQWQQGVGWVTKGAPPQHNGGNGGHHNALNGHPGMKQAFLISHGYHITHDGQAGPQTRAAWHAYQNGHAGPVRFDCAADFAHDRTAYARQCANWSLVQTRAKKNWIVMDFGCRLDHPKSRRV